LGNIVEQKLFNGAKLKKFLWFYFRGTNMRHLHCTHTSWLPCPKPGNSCKQQSEEANWCNNQLIRTASDDSCGGGLGTRLHWVIF